MGTVAKTLSLLFKPTLKAAEQQQEVCDSQGVHHLHSRWRTPWLLFKSRKTHTALILEPSNRNLDNVTIFSKWSQNFKDHLLLLVFCLLLEETHQLLSNVGGCKLLFAGLWKTNKQQPASETLRSSSIWWNYLSRRHSDSDQAHCKNCCLIINTIEM